jgi:hypothetical protein
MRALPVLMAMMAVTQAVPTLDAADVEKPPGLMERLLHPTNKKSSYEGKVFGGSASYSGKTFRTDQYAGVKEFASKSFGTKLFEAGRKSWAGKLMFPEKKLPENLQGANRDSGKAFGSKDLPEKNYASGDKRSGYAEKGDFSTQSFFPKGKTQGAIDNNQQLQEAIKKGLTVDDVRKLLNKGP